MISQARYPAAITNTSQQREGYVADKSVLTKPVRVTDYHKAKEARKAGNKTKNPNTLQAENKHEIKFYELSSLGTLCRYGFCKLCPRENLLSLL